MNFDTNCLHAGYQPAGGEPRNIPIIQSTTFRYETKSKMYLLPCRWQDVSENVLV